MMDRPAPGEEYKLEEPGCSLADASPDELGVFLAAGQAVLGVSLPRAFLSCRVFAFPGRLLLCRFPSSDNMAKCNLEYVFGRIDQVSPKLSLVLPCLLKLDCIS